jgi:hypothetical protein
LQVIVPTGTNQWIETVLPLMLAIRYTTGSTLLANGILY